MFGSGRVSHFRSELWTSEMLNENLQGCGCDVAIVHWRDIKDHKEIVGSLARAQRGVVNREVLLRGQERSHSQADAMQAWMQFVEL